MTIAVRFFQIPESIMNKSDFLQEMDKHEDFQLLIPMDLDIVLKFIQKGEIRWENKFFRIMTYYLIEGFQEAVMKAIRLFGGKEKAKLAIQYQIAPATILTEWFDNDLPTDKAVKIGILFPIPKEDWQRYFAYFAQNGHLDVVKFLANLVSVDPEADKNCALGWAAMNGHLEVVKFLANLDLVDPGADKWALRWAGEKGQLDVIKFLVSLDSVDPSAHNNDAIKSAAYKGQLDVVKFLAGLDSVNPGDSDNIAIKTAAHNGHLDVVKFLSSLDSVNPDYSISPVAVLHGHLEIIKFLDSLNQ